MSLSRLARVPVRSALVTQRHSSSKNGFSAPLLSTQFSKWVFDEKDMHERLPASIFKRWKESVTEGKPLALDVADVIATALKDWAVERGVTHYSHWFQPWTSGPAEKHDGFLVPTLGGSRMIFSGKALVNGETDGSSFPGGGLRATHEARGYTVWDPASAPFIFHLSGQDPTLFIPTLFYSWKGDALDRKIPLLRSVEALKKHTLGLFDACQLRQHKTVHSDSGIEQEFFLLDAEQVRRRPDLSLCGRTLQGRSPAKGQELSDSYFGPMTAKTLHVIHQMEQECWKLGIPITTRHREVCPNQYEMAPVFEKASIACDHNLALMNVMEHVARDHGLVAVLHEKPFAHVNGSGKHNNWSVGTDVKGTLFAPGDSPASNLEFLLALAGVIRGADIHADLLRWCISGASNDHRLGGHEAPPAIVSLFAGSELSALIKAIATGQTFQKSETRIIDLGIPHLARTVADASDRNRTSPFAFTGNKFEVRAVGSSQNATASNTVLNVLLADSFRFMEAEVRRKVASGKQPRDAAMEVIKEIFQKHNRIIFDGNGYSAEWRDEAARRGLGNHRTTPDILDVVSNSKKCKDTFVSLGVYNEREFAARNLVMYEAYGNKINIESNILLDMSRQHILPAALRTQASFNQAIPFGSKPPAGHRNAIDTLSSLVSDGFERSEKLAEHGRRLNELGVVERARYAVDQVLPAMAELRESLDEIEGRMDKRDFPFPSYQDMLHKKH